MKRFDLKSYYTERKPRNMANSVSGSCSKSTKNAAGKFDAALNQEQLNWLKSFNAIN
ncbi:MAG: hypothetical protein AB7F23_06265 [Phycisphaerae bacterium]|jgi:hypothetical protein